MNDNVIIKREALESIMIGRNLSRAELSRSMMISHSYLNKIIDGERRVTPKIRRKLMDALRVDDQQWDELFEMSA